MTEHVCSMKYVFHNRYFSFRVNNQDFMEPEQTKSKWFVIKPLAVSNYTENIWRLPGGYSTEKRPPDIRSHSSVTTPRDSVNGKISDVPLHVRD